MIVFTTGTSEPFDRLVAVADDVAAACSEPVLVQGGRSACRPRHAAFVDFMPYDELLRSVSNARAVVAHAGVGSTLVALNQGRRPFVVPRLRRFGEAVDDHQLTFARRLQELGLVHLVENADDLPRLLAADRGDALGSVGTGALAFALRDHLREVIGAPRGGPER